ncbi:MAG: PAS domain-containing sensor histidine kinase [Proteobacteria bacterium]|nr:PAS domain-containing sensor histidine kinase [Pseudomonadota bacterium]
MTATSDERDYLHDTRIAALATALAPAWLWSVDASRLLWANPIAAAMSRLAEPGARQARRFTRDDPAVSDVLRLAATLPTSGTARLERLRGFGADAGRLLLCSCALVTLGDDSAAILIIARENAGPALRLDERVLRVLAQTQAPIAAFAADGRRIHATAAGARLLGRAQSLADIGIEALARTAIAHGRSEGQSTLGPVVILRLGADATSVLAVDFSPPRRQPAPASDDAFVPVALAASAAPPSAAPVPDGEAATQSAPAANAPAPLDLQVARPAPALRFAWQMDAEGRFSLSSEEFVELIGPRTATAFGRPWPQIAAALGLDPSDDVMRAVTRRDTWSGIAIACPVDDSTERLQVELSGLPIFDRERTFLGYRGFGVCRDRERIAVILAARRGGAIAADAGNTAAPVPQACPAAPQTPGPADEPQTAPTDAAAPAPPGAPTAPIPNAARNDEPPALKTMPENVVPFRVPVLAAETKAPALSPVERKAFHELARELSARLRNPSERGSPAPADLRGITAANTDAAPMREASADHRALIDRLPVGILVYRLDKLLHANRVFLDWTGYRSLEAITEAGGLDGLFIEPDANSEGDGRAFALATPQGASTPLQGRLISIPFDGEPALALVVVHAPASIRVGASDAALRQAQDEIRDLRAILDTTSDGTLVLDDGERIASANRRAELLFGYGAGELAQHPLIALFTPESRRVATELLARMREGSAENTGKGARELVARHRDGGVVPVLMSLVRIGEGGTKIGALLRDITQAKHADAELAGARRAAEQAATTKAEFLARMSHDVRTPLNTITGMAEILLDEKLSAGGEAQIQAYLRDIRAAGETIVTLLNELVDLSRIENGRFDLSFASLDLNAAVRECVAQVQPQASRERVIIRAAPSAGLPPVMADARSVRQIVANLIAGAIASAGSGGQVIVSTAACDEGGVVLRVRDSGGGLKGDQIEALLEPTRRMADTTPANGTLTLPLTRALAQANRGRLRITSRADDGTLVEVTFHAAAGA